jgi:hypothetical protein
MKSVLTLVLFFLVLTLSISLVQSITWTVDYETVNVNSSDFWDNLNTPIDMSNMTLLTINNITNFNFNYNQTLPALTYEYNFSTLTNERKQFFSVGVGTAPSGLSGVLSVNTEINLAGLTMKKWIYNQTSASHYYYNQSLPYELWYYNQTLPALTYEYNFTTLTNEDKILRTLNITDGLNMSGLFSAGDCNGFAYRGCFVEAGQSAEESAILTSDTLKGRTIAMFADTSAYFMLRDVTNNIEALFGTSNVGEFFFGSMTAHDVSLRTENVKRLIINHSSQFVSIPTSNAGLSVAVAEGSKKDKFHFYSPTLSDTDSMMAEGYRPHYSLLDISTNAHDFTQWADGNIWKLRVDRDDDLSWDEDILTMTTDGNLSIGGSFALNDRFSVGTAGTTGAIWVELAPAPSNDYGLYIKDWRPNLNLIDKSGGADNYTFWVDANLLTLQHNHIHKFWQFESDGDLKLNAGSLLVMDKKETCFGNSSDFCIEFDGRNALFKEGVGNFELNMSVDNVVIENNITIIDSLHFIPTTMGSPIRIGTDGNILADAEADSLAINLERSFYMDIINWQPHNSTTAHICIDTITQKWFLNETDC